MTRTNQQSYKGLKKVVWITALTFFVMLFMLGNAYAKRRIIKVDGSSTVYPITEAVAEEFQVSHRGAMVTIGVSGTGGGFKKFCRGETDVTNASRTIKHEEIELCKKNGIAYIELPVAYDGLAVMVHPRNKWVDYLTVAELKRMWEPKAQGKVTKWNQIRKTWPKSEMHLYGPGVDSGTFDYFTKVITGKSGFSRGDFTASEDDNVLVQGISGDTNALGFFGLAYYEHNKDKLKLIPIDDGKDANGKGPILPSKETVNNGTYEPLSRPIFIYVSVKSAEKPEVEKFIDFYINNAGELSNEVGYINLPDNIYELILKRFKKRVTGSAFGGKGAKKGQSIEELLK